MGPFYYIAYLIAEVGKMVWKLGQKVPNKVWAWVYGAIAILALVGWAVG